MKPHWQPSREGLAWLLISFAAVIGLHVQDLPIWVSLAAIAVVIWRIQIYRGVWPHPPTAAKVILIGICLAGVFLVYGRLKGLEPMTAMLVSAYCLKLLECRDRRDAVVVIYLAFLVAILHSLYQQSIVAALMIGGSLLFVLAALVGIHQRVQTSLWQPLRRSAVIIGQAIPVMILLFLVMPRIGALWAVPTQKHAAKTGISDFMSPGDIAKLGRSSEVAFRVSFDGDVPPPEQRYWRGLVFSAFDGRSWSYAPVGYREGSVLQWVGEPRKPWLKNIQLAGDSYKYRVILEPTHQPWLFGLETALPQSQGTGLTRDLRLINRMPVAARTAYQAHSWPEAAVPDSTSMLRRDRELRLPSGSNPQTQQIAKQWRSESGSEQAYIDRVLRLFNREFIYTLEPPLLGKHSVDEFLWQSKQGFCEHFASSFVFMMRAAGLPARVVAGYQGGEYQAQAGYMVVRQYDAHAWAEVWLEGRGWTRVDPTAAVAPERIRVGSADLFANDDAFASEDLWSLEQFRDMPVMNLLRLKWDEMEYAWTVWVLGYEDQQGDLLSRMLGNTSPLRVALFLVGGGGAIMLLLMLWNLRLAKPERKDETSMLWLKFCRKMARAGVERDAGEGVRQYSVRLQNAFPRQSNEIDAIACQFEQMLYDPAPELGSNPLQNLKRAIRRLSLR